MKSVLNIFYVYLISTISILFIFNTAFSQQTAGQLYEKALYLEEAKGELQQAIELYQQIVKQYSDNREVAAKSLLHIGLCKERLGLKEAQKAYQQVIDSYPEQTEVVEVAQKKLSLLLRVKAVISNEDRAFNIRQVWVDSDVSVLGAPSPDGRYISYVDWDTGDLAIYEISTGKKRRLTNKGSWDESDEFAEFSRWSPDGTQIFYDWYNKKGFIDLCVIGLDGSKPRILYSNEEVEWAQTYDCSPDGKQILACFSKKDDINQIVLVSSFDGSVRVLKSLGKHYPHNMSLSPDGRYIVYDFPQDEESSERDISLLPTDGSNEISLVKHPANDFVLGWVPDGKNILFASDRTGTPGIWAMRITEGSPQGNPRLVKLTKEASSPVGLGFTRDGSFYYGHDPMKTDVYITEIDPKTGKIRVPAHEAINRFIESNTTPDYSPDGKYLAYVSRQPPMSEYFSSIPSGNVLCIRSLDTGEDREFRPGINKFGWPRWSPDGSSVTVVNWNIDGHMGYHQINTQTGKVTPLLINEDTRLFGRHELSLDGKTLFYGHSDSNHQVIMHDLESGMEKVLYISDDRFNLCLSRDGQWLALIFRSQKNASLSILPVVGGEPRELCRFTEEKKVKFEGDCAISWSPDGEYIFFSMKELIKDDPKWELCRISVNGGEPQKLGLEMIMFYNLCVHPDGRHIAFSSHGSTVKTGEIWVMENFLSE